MSGMTSGERAVWAAEFVRARGSAGIAAKKAAAAVVELRAVLSSVGDLLSDDERAMLVDITGDGGDRCHH